jgi:hypothetical protein
LAFARSNFEARGAAGTAPAAGAAGGAFWTHPLMVTFASGDVAGCGARGVDWSAGSRGGVGCWLCPCADRLTANTTPRQIADTVFFITSSEGLTIMGKPVCESRRRSAIARPAAVT